MAVSYYQQHRPREATVTVSLSPDFSGDFVGDGVADQVEINAAIVFAGAMGGGVVHLLNCPTGVTYYDLTASIVDGGYDNIVLEGEGENTVLRIANNTVASNIRIEADVGWITGWIIRDLTIDGNKANNPNSGPAGIDLNQNGITFAAVTHSKIIRVHLHDTVMHGINIWSNSTDNQVVDCYIHDCGEVGDYVGQAGILVYQESLRNIISSNRIVENYARGIYCSDDSHYNLFEKNIISGGIAATVEGIYIFDGADHNTVSENTILGEGGLTEGIVVLPYDADYPLYTIISNNQIVDLDGYGIRCESDYSIIDGNHVYDPSGPGIRAARLGIVVYGNVVIQSGEYGFYISANDCTVVSNLATGCTSDGILVAGADDTIIMGNQFTGNTNYGIRILDAACDRTRVFHNRLTGNIAGAILDAGTDTRLATKVFQFIQGTTFISADGSAKGWEINAEADMAITLPQLPLEVQRVVRLKIWAVALDAPPGAGGYMHLDLLFNGGGSLEDYNLAANSWTLANFNGEEADYANGKVIHWVVEDGDVGNEIRNLLGGDSLELKVNGGTAVGDDGATNAVLKALEIEYV